MFVTQKGLGALRTISQPLAVSVLPVLQFRRFCMVPSLEIWSCEPEVASEMWTYNVEVARHKEISVFSIGRKTST